MCSYSALIGRRALGLSTVGSLWRAALTVLLSTACGVDFNYVAFRLYVVGRVGSLRNLVRGSGNETLMC